MEIRINGEQIDFQLESEKNIGDILGSVESECEKSGMTITGIRVDGIEIPADSLDGLFLRDIGSVSSMDLTTITGKDVERLLRDLGTKFSVSVSLLQEVPVLLQTGKDLQVLEYIHRFSSDLQNLYQLLPLLTIAGITTGAAGSGSADLEAYPSELAPILGQLLAALEAKDTVLVGDLSEYELAPRIEKLGAALAAVRSGV